MQVKDQILLAGREGDRWPVALGRFAAIVKTTETNDGFSPHDSRIPGKLPHQLQHSQAISASLFVSDSGKILVYAGIVLVCFQFCHRGFLRGGYDHVMLSSVHSSCSIVHISFVLSNDAVVIRWQIDVGD